MNENRRYFLNKFYKEKLSSLPQGLDRHTIYTWKIYAEDQNCDLGGPHSNAFIGHFVGTFEEAAEHATSLPGFFTWGGGGYIQEAEDSESSKTIADKKKLPTADEARQCTQKHIQMAVDKEMDWLIEKIHAKLSASLDGCYAEMRVTIKYFQNVKTLTEHGYEVKNVNDNDYTVTW